MDKEHRVRSIWRGSHQGLFYYLGYGKIIWSSYFINSGGQDIQYPIFGQFYRISGRFQNDLLFATNRMLIIENFHRIVPFLSAMFFGFKPRYMIHIFGIVDGISGLCLKTEANSWFVINLKWIDSNIFFLAFFFLAMPCTFYSKLRPFNPLTLVFCPFLKKTLGNSYLKILDLSKLFVVASPMKKTPQNSVPPFQSTLC